MSLATAIAAGKEHRTPYRRSQAVDSSCRNHGRCRHCRENRTYNNRKRLLAADAAYAYWDAVRRVPFVACVNLTEATHR